MEISFHCAKWARRNRVNSWFNILIQVKKRWTTASTRIRSRWLWVHADSSTLRLRQGSQTRNEGPDETVQSILLIAELDWICLRIFVVSQTVSFPRLFPICDSAIVSFPPSATGVFLVTKIYYYYCIIQLALWSGFSRRELFRAHIFPFSLNLISFSQHARKQQTQKQNNKGIFWRAVYISRWSCRAMQRFSISLDFPQLS